MRLRIEGAELHRAWSFGACLFDTWLSIAAFIYRSMTVAARKMRVKFGRCA